MQAKHVFQAWGSILAGRAPALSLEITKECPLRCPGCYAYEDNHLGGETNLRQLSDFKGDELVERVLALVDRERPLHVSIVGGDPLVRYREMDRLLPALSARGIHVQLVTSAFRPISPEWVNIENLSVAVSIDGLQPEHDVRRAPATYKRILANIAGQRVTVHCTITSQMMDKPGYLEEFTRFWSGQDAVWRIWFSIFTPQRGTDLAENLTWAQRQQVVDTLIDLRRRYPKLKMGEGQLRAFMTPPQSPDECIFAITTHSISADLETKIGPCQLGGDPDCTRCGCAASVGMEAVGRHKLGGVVPLGAIFRASLKVGGLKPHPAKAASPFPVLTGRTS